MAAAVRCVDYTGRVVYVFVRTVTTDRVSEVLHTVDDWVFRPTFELRTKHKDSETIPVPVLYVHWR